MDNYLLTMTHFVSWQLLMVSFQCLVFLFIFALLVVRTVTSCIMAVSGIDDDSNDEISDIPPKIELLCDRMKAYESESSIVNQILPYQPFTVRLDGKNFSRVLKGLDKPFDELFSIAMRNTAVDLSKEFNPKTVHVQSDEMTLCYSSYCTEEEFATKENLSQHPFNGKVFKIISNMAGFASTRFTCHMINLLKAHINDKIIIVPLEGKSEDKETDIKKKLLYENYYKQISTETGINATYSFDARVTVFPSDKNFEIVNNVLWRSQYDGYRNFVSMLANHYIVGKKSIHGKSTSDRINMLKAIGIDIANYPSHYKYGWIIKNTQVTETRYDRNKQPIVVSRNRQVAVSFDIKYSPEMSAVILDKYLPEETTTFKYAERVMV